MSTQAMTWAIAQRTGGPSAKTVLWSIANYANQHWCAWPSQALIVEESEQSPDSIQRRIPDLEALGLIRRIPLKFGGRKTVDFIILAPSFLFQSSVAEIEPYLPRGCVIDPKWASLHAAADRGNVETGTSKEASNNTLPQTLPQPAADVAAMVRQQEPSTEPREPLRENARASSQQVKATFDALAEAWINGAIGGAGAMGDTTKAMAAIAALDPDDHAMAVERAPRFLRSIKDAKRSYTMGIESYVHGRQFVHHPPPANADPSLVQPVELKPYVVPLWAMYWKAVHKARQATGDDRNIRRLKDCTDWLERGVVTPAGMIPGEDDIASLVPIKVDSPEHLAWQDFAVRINARLPRPDHVPVIYVPATWPPTLLLAGTKPYRLATPLRVEVRGPVWWWRFFASIEDGTPIVSTLAGRHRVDLLEPARRSAGAQEVDYGPIPLPAELAAMVEVKTLTDAFEQWSTWIAARGGDLAMWPHGSIWVPSEYPTLIFGQAKQVAGAAA
jgi:hypothetical protein